MDVRALYAQGKRSPGKENDVQWEVLHEQLLKERGEDFSRMNPKEQAEHLISEANHSERASLYSCAVNTASRPPAITATTLPSGIPKVGGHSAASATPSLPLVPAPQ